MKRRKPHRVLTNFGEPIDLLWIERPSLGDLMAEGTADEIREALESIGRCLQDGIEIFQDERVLVGAALEAIGRGESPKAAFGLTTNRRIPLVEKRARAALAESMVQHDGILPGRADDIAYRLAFKSDGKAYLADLTGVTQKVRKRKNRAKPKDKPPL